MRLFRLLYHSVQRNIPIFSVWSFNMAIGCDFFVDLSCTIILQVLNTIVDKETDATRLRYLSLVRICLGFFVNVGLFVAVCIVNYETYIQTTEALILFIFTIVYTVVFYFFIVLFTIWCIIMSADEDDSLENANERARKIFWLIVWIYKIFEIIFDICCLVYVLAVQEFELTSDFNIAMTCIASGDIFINVFQVIFTCYRNCRDYVSTESST